MKIALDTNRYVDFCQGEPTAADAIARSERIYLPLIVLAELRAGFRAGTRAKTNERILTRFLSSPRVRLLLPDEQTTFHYAAIFADLRQRRAPIPTNDLWIAALTIQHSLTLLTRDAHFGQIPNLSKM